MMVSVFLGGARNQECIALTMLSSMRSVVFNLNQFGHAWQALFCSAVNDALPTHHQGRCRGCVSPALSRVTIV